MTPTDAEGQVEMLVAMPRGRERNSRGSGCGAFSAWTTKEYSEQERQDLMSAVVERENMLRALRRVQSNTAA